MRPDGLVHSDGPAILAGSDAPSLQVPDGFDIFSAQFSRDGEDLVIAAEGSPPLTVIDYFTADSPPALEMPNGAMLTGDVVELLAGPRAPGQYAQADAPEGGVSIGQVETLSGSSTATRVSGETVELAQGDPVFQGDVIETAGDSTLGIRLEDGTLASMSSQSRLVLNEFVYETGGSDNWMVVNLVQGAFAFLTGAIAPSGGMEITTPVAVMAIRGTMPVAFVAGEDGASQFFAASDQDYELLHLTTREVLAVISSEAGFSLSSPDAPLETIELDPETLDEIEGLLDVLNDAAAELGLLGIQDGSGFHTYSSFGSIGTVQLIEFLLLLDNALAEEAVLEVEDPNQFLMAEAQLTASPDQAATDEMSPVTIDVLDNDSHPDDEDLTVVFADVPSGQGSVSVVDGQYLVFEPGTDFDYLALGETTDVVITYVVSDSTGAIASTTATVTLTGINQAPVIAPVDGTSLVEQTDTQPLNTTVAVTFTDVDLNNVGHQAAVVDVAVNGEDGGLTLNTAALMALVSAGTVIKNAGEANGSVDFDFTAASSVFDYLADGEIVTLTYTVEIDDGDGGTSLETFDVTVTGTNDVPVVSGVSTGAVTEDAHSTTLITGGVLAIADADAGESNFAPQGNVAGTYGTFTLLADGTWSYSADNAQAAIQALGTGDTLTDSFTAVSSDGTGSQTVTVTVHGTNDAPVVTAGGTLDYTENDSAAVIDASITIADVDSSSLTGATVTITGNFAAGEDVLGFTSQNGITGSYNAAIGVLTLTGTATVAQYQAALASVTYFNSSDDPSGGDRTVSFRVNDGEDLSDVATSTVKVTVTGINDAPVVTTTDGVLAYTENDAPTAIDASITIADLDSSSLTGATVSITGNFVAGEDVLGFTSQNGITGSWNAATGVLTLTGTATLAQYQAALASVTYVNTSDDPSGADRTISFQVNDGEDLSNVATSTVTVEPVNDDPVISVVGDDSDGAVLTADEATPTSFVLSADQGDPGYTAGATATVTFHITRGDGSEEVITIEDLMMGPSHELTLSELVARINSEDNGLEAVYKAHGTNAWQFTLFVDGGALDAEDLRVVFDNPHSDPPNSFEFGVVVLEQGSDAEGVSATGTLSVGDVDAADVVNASVIDELTIGGSGASSLPSDLDEDALLAMMSVGTNPVIGSGDTTGQIAWSFDSGDEVFGFLDPEETLVLTYTIAATDSAGAVTEHQVTITINGAGSETQLLASSGDLETSSSLMFSSDLESGTDTLHGDTEGEVYVLTETDLTIDDVIIDYQEGDVIDLTQLGFELATGQFTADAAGEYVAYDQAAGVLSVDMDGAGTEADFEAAAEFVTPPPSILVRLSDGDTTADIAIA